MKSIPIFENHDQSKSIGTVWTDDAADNLTLNIRFNDDQRISLKKFFKLWNCPIEIVECIASDSGTIYIKQARILYFNYENRPPVTAPPIK